MNLLTGKTHYGANLLDMWRTYKIWLMVLALSLAGQVAFANDARYCTNKPRDADGDFKRSTAIKAQFKLLQPCYGVGDFVVGAGGALVLRIPQCAVWDIDHVRPLSRCGCDSIINLQWLPDVIKSCSYIKTGVYCKDRWELKAYQCKAGDLP